MARDSTQQLKDNATTANGLSGTYGSRAAGNANILTPTLNSMARTPQGYGVQDLANMKTDALQTVGGGLAGQIGGAAATAARTNNTGSGNSLALAAGHDATGTLSEAALGIDNQNAQLKEQQRQSALAGLEGMYGQNISAGNQALGLSTQATNAAEQASQNGFFKNATSGLLSRITNPASYAGYQS